MSSTVICTVEICASLATTPTLEVVFDSCMPRVHLKARFEHGEVSDMYGRERPPERSWLPKTAGTAHYSPSRPVSGFPCVPMMTNDDEQAIDDDPQGEGGAFSLSPEATLVVRDTTVIGAVVGKKVRVRLFFRAVPSALHLRPCSPSPRPCLPRLRWYFFSRGSDEPSPCREMPVPRSPPVDLHEHDAVTVESWHASCGDRYINPDEVVRRRLEPLSCRPRARWVTCE